jgi:hypothetical protein
MNISSIVLFAITSILCRTASAHHSFAAEYDANQPVAMKGVLRKVEWQNPHIRWSTRHAHAQGHQQGCTQTR